MTTLRKSDSQLDAEAAANAAIRTAGPNTTWSPMGLMPGTLYCRQQPHTLRLVDQHGSLHETFCCLVHEARFEWHYALPDDIHVFRVPSDLETIPIVGEVLDVGQLGGPPFSITFIGHLEQHADPIVRGLREQRRLCASRHSTWPDHRGQAVCGSLLWSVVANGNSPDDAADAVDLTPERATALLYGALSRVWAWRSREANGLRSA